MDGKKLILLIIVVSILGLAIAWFWGQKMIDKYDLERAMSAFEFIQTKFDNKYYT